MTGTFISHSGAEAGRPNIHELRLSGGRLWLDCGAGGGGGPTVGDLEGPDALWISHAHGDHCGGLLELIGDRPRTPVVATETTARLLEFALAGGGGSKTEKRRAEAIGRKIRTVPMRRFRSVPGIDGARIMALPAGHVPGAAMAVVEFEEDDEARRLLYTGDFCTHDQAVVGGAGIPHADGGFSVDAVVSEAMLANDEGADDLVWADEAEGLAEAVVDAEGPVVVGVSAIGESTEVAALVARAGEPVMVDEYLRPVFEAVRPRLADEWSSLTFGDRSRMKGRLRADGVVVAAGDQFRSNTTAGRLAGPLIGDSAATIAVLNRARSNTGAGRLTGTDRGDQIRWNGRTIGLEARVVHRRLINHAPRWQLTGFIEGVSAPKTLLVHGPTGSRWGLKRALQRRGFDGEVEVVERGEEYEVVGGSG